jgi:hypothetical protein
LEIYVVDIGLEKLGGSSRSPLLNIANLGNGGCPAPARSGAHLPPTQADAAESGAIPASGTVDPICGKHLGEVPLSGNLHLIKGSAHLRPNAFGGRSANLEVHQAGDDQETLAEELRLQPHGLQVINHQGRKLELRSFCCDLLGETIFQF